MFENGNNDRELVAVAPCTRGGKMRGLHCQFSKLHFEYNPKMVLFGYARALDDQSTTHNTKWGCTQRPV